MFKDLRPYPSRVDQSLGWTPQLPSGWGTVRLKRAFGIRGGATPDRARPEYWGGDIPWVTPRAMKTPRISGAPQHVTPDAVAASALSVIEPPALLLVVRGMILARRVPVAVSSVPVTVNQDMKALVPRPGVLAGYYTHVIGAAEPHLLAATSSAGHGTLKLDADVWAELRLPVPPLEEQVAIVKYLTHAHRRIDRTIAAKRKLIALLEEQKQAVISHAVTRGLDPNAPLKDSGVSWIGRVPHHWDVLALRHRYSQALGKMLDASRFTGRNALPYLRNVDVQWDSINTADLPEMDVAEHEYDRYCVEPGDLLICEGGEVGRAAIWRGTERVAFQKALHRLRPIDSKRDEPVFMLSVMKAAVGLDAFNDGHVSTISHLTGDKLRRQRFAFPPLDEQCAIVAHVAAETAATDAAIDRTRREIDLLGEFRTRLTSDVVTGQVDVRHIAAALPDLDPTDEPDDVGPDPDDGDDELLDALEGVDA